MTAFAKLTWPAELSCTRFPERNEGESMCIDYNLHQQQAAAATEPALAVEKLLKDVQQNNQQQNAKNVIEEIVEKARSGQSPTSSTTLTPATPTDGDKSSRKPTSIFSTSNSQQMCVNLESDLRRAAFHTPANFQPVSSLARERGTSSLGSQSVICVQSCQSDIRYDSHQKMTAQISMFFLVSIVFCCSAVSFLALMCKAQTSTLAYGGSSSATITSPINTLKLQTPAATYDPATGTTLLVSANSTSATVFGQRNGQWLLQQQQQSTRRPTRLPDIVRYVALCTLLVCVGYIIRLAGGRSGGCAIHMGLNALQNSGEAKNSAAFSPLQQIVMPKPAMPFLITSNDWSSTPDSDRLSEDLDYGGRCVVSFVFTQYFSSAANLWLLVLGLTCVLERSLFITSQKPETFSISRMTTFADRIIRRQWWQTHLFVWALSALPIAYGFYSRAIDSEELLATCGLGQTDAGVLLRTIIIPHTVLLLVGSGLTFTILSGRNSKSADRRCGAVRFFSRCFAKMSRHQHQYADNRTPGGYSTNAGHQSSSSSQSYTSSCSSSSAASRGMTAGRDSNHYAAPDMPPFNAQSVAPPQQQQISYDERRFRKYQALSVFLLVVWIFSTIGMLVVATLHYNLLIGQQPHVSTSAATATETDISRKMLPYDAVRPWPADFARILLLLRIVFGIGVVAIVLPLFSINCLASPLERCMRSVLNGRKNRRSDARSTTALCVEHLPLNTGPNFALITTNPSLSSSGEPVSPSSFVMKRPTMSNEIPLAVSTFPAINFATSTAAGRSNVSAAAAAAAAEMLPFQPFSQQQRQNANFTQQQLHYPSLASSYTNNQTAPSFGQNHHPLQSFTVWQQVLAAAAAAKTNNSALPPTTTAPVMPAAAAFCVPHQQASAVNFYANQQSSYPRLQQQQTRSNHQRSPQQPQQQQSSRYNGNFYNEQVDESASIGQRNNNNNYCSDDCCSESNEGSTTCRSNNGGQQRN